MNYIKKMLWFSLILFFICDCVASDTIDEPCFRPQKTQITSAAFTGATLLCSVLGTIMYCSALETSRAPDNQGLFPMQGYIGMGLLGMSAVGFCISIPLDISAIIKTKKYKNCLKKTSGENN